jgi:hypothetical protein
MCSFWLNVAFINTNLIFDTGCPLFTILYDVNVAGDFILLFFILMAALMCCFILIGKGWSITRVIVHPQEWRGILIAMSTFYMANSIILVSSFFSSKL